MKTAERRAMAERILKDVLNRIQELEMTKRAFVLAEIGFPSKQDKIELAEKAKQLGMPLAAEKIFLVNNVTVDERFVG